MSRIARLVEALRDPLAAAAVVVLFLYCWTASQGLPFEFGRSQDRPYNLLTRSLLAGRLDLAIAPRPELFELANPYEPGRNAWLRLHDASLYHGRYYFYFGIVPALVAFAPWHLAGLGDLPEPVAAVAFAFLAFLFASLLLRRLLRTHFGKVPGGLQFASFLVLGIANVLPFLLRSPRVYEVAITGGLAFSSAAAWLLLKAGESTRWTRFALGGLCLGLAVGCRPNLLVLAAVLPLLAWSSQRERRARSLADLAAIVLPLGACLLLLGIYNHARFDSWTEFGTSYQLVGARPISHLDYRTLPSTLYYLFTAPPSFSLDFPLVRPYHAWSFHWTAPDGYFVDEHTTGLLVQAPFLLALTVAPWILGRVTLRDAATLKRRMLVLAGAGLLLPVATSLAFSSTAMRFEADFATFLVVPALCVWFALLRDDRLSRSRAVRVTGVLVLAWSLLLALALSLTGATDDLRRANPDLYDRIERAAEPLRVSLGRVLDPEGRLTVRLRVAFPERMAAPVEPLLSWGRVQSYDVLWAASRGEDSYDLTLDTAAARSQREATTAAVGCGGLRLKSGEFHDFVFDLDRVKRRVLVEIDGRRTCQLTGHLVGLHPNRAWPGRGPRGSGAPEIGAFTGTIVPEAMRLAGPPGLDELPPILPAPALVASRRSDRPAAAVGQLRLVAGRAGADILTQRGWRWLPCPRVERVWLERRLDPATDDKWHPLLASGDASGADAVIVRQLAGGRCRVALARWQVGWRIGAAGAAVRIRDGTAGVLLDGVRGLAIVTLDGQEALRARAELLPLSGPQLEIGALPAGVPSLPTTLP